MNRISAVLLAFCTSVSHQGLAQNAREQAPVNQFKSPVLLQQQRIIYQQQELEQQQAQLTSADLQAQRPPAAIAASAMTTTQNNSAPLNPALEIFSLGEGIGYNGLLSGDYNNDGITELVFGNPGSVVFGQAVDGKFKLQTQLNFYSGISKLEYFRDISSDGHYAFFIQNQILQKLDLITRRVVDTLDVGYVSSMRMQEQAAGAASVLLMRTSSNHLRVIDPVTLKILHSHAGFYHDIAALGSFTLKDKPQILFNDGQIYNFNDGSNITFEKSITFNGYSLNRAVDVNQDGLHEMLVSAGWNSITLTSPLTNETLWSKQTSHDIHALTLADADQDGKLDGVYGDGQWGSLYAFNLLTGKDFWTIANPDHGVTNIVIADLDNDTKPDIGWGAGFSSSGADYFYIHDLETKALKWQSEDIQFPVNAVAMADIDQDGDLDALAVSTKSNSGYDGGVIQAYDIQTQTRLWQTSAANNWGNTMNIIAEDLDKDGKTELIIGSSEIYNGLVRVLNGANGQERFKKLLGSGDNVTSMVVADLDNDGFNEIIVGNGAEHTGSAGVYFTVLDGRTGEVKKKSPSLNFNWQGLSDLTPVEVNGNTVVYGLFNGNLYQFDYSQNTIKQLTSSNNYRHMTKAVVAGVTELVISKEDGKLLRVSTAGVELASTTVCADVVPTGLSSSGPDRVLFNCQSSFGEYNWFTNSSSFTHQTHFLVAGDPKWVRHKDQDYYMVGGEKVAVYNAQTQAALPKPDPVKLTTHVLKSITGTMTIPAEVDYFVLANSTKAGQFSFTDRKTGKFIYQPAGTTGIETLKYYAVKGQALSSEAELTIELTNAKPVVDHMTIATHWNKTVQLTLTAKDDDQEALQFALTSGAKHGQLKLQDPAKGTVEYIPSGDSLEPVSFGFTAKDSLQTSDQKNVVITLTNTAPVAVAKSYTTSYQTPVNGALQGQDADNDVLSYEISSQPSAGSLTLDSKNGLFVYTPSGDADQSISFSFIVKDKFASSTVQTVNISVQGAPKKSSGGALSWFSMAALLLFVMRRRYPQ